MPKIDSETSSTGNTRDVTGLFTLNINNNPTPGEIFFDTRCSVDIQNEFSGYYAITTDGDSIHFTPKQYATDFNLKQSGYFGVYNRDKLRYEVLDSNFNLIDKYYAVNGYDPDEHEFRILPDGHAFIIADEYQVIDMTVYNSDYSDSCTVNSSVIQEFDASHNLVFEWRSFDYIAVTEATHVDLSFDYVDYVHTNSIDIDTDGNIIASHRRIDQVTKIDRNTGAFIWRLGGIMNQFTFINEPEIFTFQHDARRLANGDITLYDNGNFHSTPHSSAKEYKLDEVNKTATLVWSYSHPNGNGGNLFYTAMGSVQRLSNGNSLIDWGWRKVGTSDPSISEVTSDGTIVWEATLTTQDNMVSYRARKQEWDPCARPTYKKLDTKSVTATSAKPKWSDVAGVVKYKVQYKKHNDAIWTEKSVGADKNTVKLNNLIPSTKYDWKIETWCAADGNNHSGFTEIKKFTTLSIKESLTPEVNQEIILYPNPAHDYITVKSSGGWSRLRIMNMLGTEVLELNNKSDGADLIQIPIDLPAGNYLLELISNEKGMVGKLEIN